MRYELYFGGRPLSDFDAFVADCNGWDAVERDVETVDVPGRNGSIVLDNGRFQNVQVTYTMYIPEGSPQQLNHLRAYLLSVSSYARLEDTLHPDEFRLARHVSGPTDIIHDRKGASFSLTFDCKPQRFLRTGGLPVTVSGSGLTLYNPTSSDALPLIRAYGASGTITVGDVSVTVTGATTYIDIDCDLMDAYEGSTNRNSNITLTDGEFPYLAPGSNNVSFTGFSYLVITPRWWTL